MLVYLHTLQSVQMGWCGMVAVALLAPPLCLSYAVWCIYICILTAVRAVLAVVRAVQYQVGKPYLVAVI
jgi:hypothetical protein